MIYILKAFTIVAIVALLPVSLPATTILVPQPAPGAVALIDTIVQISWLYPGPVNVYLVQGGNTIQQLAAGVTATVPSVPGIIQWKITNVVPPGSYQIKVVSVANPGADMGLSGVFSVQKAGQTSIQTTTQTKLPRPVILSPPRGTVVQAGSPILISWQLNDLPPDAFLKIWAGGTELLGGTNNSWVTRASVYPSIGYKVPSTAAPTHYFRIKLMYQWGGFSGYAPMPEGETVITITNPTPPVGGNWLFITAPAPGATLKMGGPWVITWRHGLPSTAKITVGLYDHVNIRGVGYDTTAGSNGAGSFTWPSMYNMSPGDYELDLGIDKILVKIVP